MMIVKFEEDLFAAANEAMILGRNDVIKVRKPIGIPELRESCFRCDAHLACMLLNGRHSQNQLQESIESIIIQRSHKKQTTTTTTRLVVTIHICSSNNYDE